MKDLNSNQDNPYAQPDLIGAEEIIFGLYEWQPKVIELLARFGKGTEIKETIHATESEPLKMSTFLYDRTKPITVTVYSAEEAHIEMKCANSKEQNTEFEFIEVKELEQPKVPQGEGGVTWEIRSKESAPCNKAQTDLMRIRCKRESGIVSVIDLLLITNIPRQCEKPDKD